MLEKVKAKVAGLLETLVQVDRDELFEYLPGKGVHVHLKRGADAEAALYQGVECVVLHATSNLP